jgi:hypothetical protein
MFELYVGAGKSRIIGAVLWFLFQHDASNLVIITSYTWKAADLLATPYNAAYSSSKIAGVNPKRPHQIPGHSADSVSLVNPNIVMIINDEISLTHPYHLQVNCLCITKFACIYIVLTFA